MRCAAACSPRCSGSSPREAFGSLLSRTLSYNLLSGTLTAVVAFLLWIYYGPASSCTERRWWPRSASPPPQAGKRRPRLVLMSNQGLTPPAPPLSESNDSPARLPEGLRGDAARNSIGNRPRRGPRRSRALARARRQRGGEPGAHGADGSLPHCGCYTEEMVSRIFSDSTHIGLRKRYDGSPESVNSTHARAKRLADPRGERAADPRVGARRRGRRPLFEDGAGLVAGTFAHRKGRDAALFASFTEGQTALPLSGDAPACETCGDRDGARPPVWPRCSERASPRAPVIRATGRRPRGPSSSSSPAGQSWCWVRCSRSCWRWWFRRSGGHLPRGPCPRLRWTWTTGGRPFRCHVARASPETHAPGAPPSHRSDAAGSPYDVEVRDDALGLTIALSGLARPAREQLELRVDQRSGLARFGKVFLGA